MAVVERARRLGRLLVSQADFFWRIIILKIRIIGFANKRNDLFTHLGRTIFLHERDGAPGQPPANKIIKDIRETEREILEAEAGIDKTAGQAREERLEYFKTAENREKQGKAPEPDAQPRREAEPAQGLNGEDSASPETTLKYPPSASGQADPLQPS